MKLRQQMPELTGAKAWINRESHEGTAGRRKAGTDSLLVRQLPHV